MAGAAHRMFRVRESVKRVAERFPVVLVLSCVASFVGVLQVAGLVGDGDVGAVLVSLLGLRSLVDASTPDTVALIQGGSLFAVPVVVAAQCAWERMPSRPPVGRVAQAVAAGVSVAIYVFGGHIAAACERQGFFFLAMAGVEAIAACLTVCMLADKDNEDALVPRICISVLFAGLLCSLLSGGFGIICVGVDFLFGLDDLGAKLFELSSVFCWMLVYPNLVVSQLPRRTDELSVPKAWNIIVGFVVLPLCLLLLGVLYLYIGRIAIIREMPVGEMNWFGCFALAVYAFLLLGVRSADGRLARWFVRWGWVLLIPVVLVQVVGVAIRVGAYGLTPARYASCLWICAGVGIMAIGALGEKRLRASWALLGIAAALAIACLSPANLFDVANFSQALRLRAGQAAVTAAAQGEAEDSRAAKLQVGEAWDYLRTSDIGYFTFPEVNDLRQRAEDGATFEELFGFERPSASGDRADSEGRRWWRVEYDSEDVSLDVTGFSRVYHLQDAADDNASNLYAEGGTVLNATWGDGTSLKVDLADLFESLSGRWPNVLVEPPLEGEYRSRLTVPTGLLRVDAGEGRVLVVTQVKRDVDLDEGGADRMEVAGYLLVP